MKAIQEITISQEHRRTEPAAITSFNRIIIEPFISNIKGLCLCLEGNSNFRRIPMDPTDPLMERIDVQICCYTKYWFECMGSDKEYTFEAQFETGNV